MKPYFCEECRQPCEGVKRDFGIGRYEYWGHMCSDHNWQFVSECCDGDLLDDLVVEEDDE